MATYQTAADQTVFVPADVVEGILAQHDDPHDPEFTLARDHIVYACTDCGSIACAASVSDVALLRRDYDMTCCNPLTTIFP